MRFQCVAAAPGTGRTVRLHPQEALLQQARALQQSEAFSEYRQRRVVVEHRLARLVQLGIRQARYFGRIKTRFQLYLAATVANLTLVGTKAGLPADTEGESSVGSALRTGTIRSTFDFVPARLGSNLDLGLAYVGLTAKIPLPEQGFPARFLVVVIKDDVDPGGIVLWQHLLGAPCFRVVFCSKTIIPDSENHPPASSRTVPKAVPRWIRG